MLDPEFYVFFSKRGSDHGGRNLCVNVLFLNQKQPKEGVQNNEPNESTRIS